MDTVIIIDADMLDRPKHRFPNLCCMKISGYEKSHGNQVILIEDYKQIKNIQYDRIYLSCVFTDTKVPMWVLILPNIICGGTGVYYDKAITLVEDIEHHMPDYYLYSHWINNKLSEQKDEKKKKKLRKTFEYYLDYSIGFTTRKCFRQCHFCVNRKFKSVELASPLSEFVDNDRKYICLLDDNMLGNPNWKNILQQLNDTEKYFQYKQGLDERLLTNEKAQILSNSKYIGDYIFAFDNIEDKPIIESKLKIWRKYNNKNTKFYVFCACDKSDIYDLEFWHKDIGNTFDRIATLMKYGCMPYIMRFEKHIDSPFYGMYVNIASWCNQPSFYKKKSFMEWCITDDKRKGGNSATIKYVNEFLKTEEGERIATKYFHLKFEDLNLYKNSKNKPYNFVVGL